MYVMLILHRTGKGMLEIMWSRVERICISGVALIGISELKMLGHIIL